MYNFIIILMFSALSLDYKYVVIIYIFFQTHVSGKGEHTLFVAVPAAVFRLRALHEPSV